MLIWQNSRRLLLLVLWAVAGTHRQDPGAGIGGDQKVEVVTVAPLGHPRGLEERPWIPAVVAGAAAAA